MKMGLLLQTMAEFYKISFKIVRSFAFKYYSLYKASLIQTVLPSKLLFILVFFSVFELCNIMVLNMG